MDNRNFSDSIKFEAIKLNLENNGGDICCELCHKKIISIGECHFDHILPYAKGGKSVLSNCQILCIKCNLKKNDKMLQEFVLEEKARRFLSGESLDVNEQQLIQEEQSIRTGNLTKDDFDKIILDFIKRKGDIHKVDFGREYNNLPSINYVRVYYGNLNNLKKSFGIFDLSLNWNRDNIKEALQKYVSENGGISQKDMKKVNNLPSIPCVLNYYPELNSFSDIKRTLCGLEVQEAWTVENSIEAGKKFAEINGKITQKDLGSENHLPTNNVIYRLFGSMEEYQKAVGVKPTKVNELITPEEYKKAVDLFFAGKERVVESSKVFFETFPYSISSIQRKYGSFKIFCDIHNIKVLKTKKFKFTKREVDDAISVWVKEGKGIPTTKELSKFGLPSQSVILKFYEDWKEPFYFYEKLYEEAKRN